MKRVLALGLSLLLVAFLSGCGGRSNPTKVTVIGRVVDSNKAPLKGAAVSLGGGSATSSYDGSFSLTANSGTATLSVSKSGFITYAEQISVSSSSPMRLGDITLLQSIPESGGAFIDPDVVIPAVANSSGSIDLELPEADSQWWTALYPRTTTVAYYNYSLAANFTGGTFASARTQVASTRAPRLVALSPRGTVRQVSFSVARMSQPLLTGGQSAIDWRMRQAEREAAFYRNSILRSSTGVRAAVRQAAVNDTRSFRKYTGFGYVPVYATLKRIGAHAEWWVDDEIRVNDASLTRWLNWFDSAYPSLTSTFGNELDVDGNGKIIVLLSTLDPGLLGFFDPLQEAPKGEYPNSNQAEILYIEAAPADPNGIPATLAHEFQHLLHFSERLRNGEAVGDSWITEAFSMLSEDIVGKGYLAGNLDAIAHVDLWLKNHSLWSLTDWRQSDVSYGCYGGAYLFGRYLYDRFGAAKILEVNRSAYEGTRSITDAVGGTFAELYQAWLAALMHRHQGLVSPDHRLNYGPDFRIVTDTERPDSGYIYGWRFFYPTDASHQPPQEVSTQWLRPWGMDLFITYGQDPDDGSAPAASGNAKATLTLSGSVSGDLGMMAVRIR